MKFALVILIAFALIEPLAFAAEPAASLAEVLDQKREIGSDLDTGTFGIDGYRLLFGEQDPVTVLLRQLAP